MSEMEPGPPHWELEVLSTGWPGKYHGVFFFFKKVLLSFKHMRSDTGPQTLKNEALMDE